MNTAIRTTTSAANRPSPAAERTPGSTVQTKLTIGAVNDPLEHEADTMADTVMRMPNVSDTFSTNSFIQRKCAHCEEEEKAQRKPLSASITPFIQTKNNGEGTTSASLSNKINSSRGGGSSMDDGTKTFMENRFGSDFSSVKIHTGAESVMMNRELNAKAFTVGNDIYFNEGQYNPQSDSGKHLLAHELTHTIQQNGAQTIQRTVHEGHDNYASYSYDDTACTLNYTQRWFFNFNVPNLSTTEKTNLMNTAAQHIHDQWSNKFPLMPYSSGPASSDACSCAGGISVNVNMTPFEGQKTGRGIQVTVVPNVRAFVNPVSGTAELEHNDTTSDFRGTTYDTGLQYTVAHEFGHTIDITDEYAWVSQLFTPVFRSDETSMMNSGNEVRTRHYQYFGDIVSMEVPGCRYNPNGVRELEFENPVSRTSTLEGITTLQDGYTLPGISTAGTFGLNYDRRVSSERLFGIFYPEVGAVRFMSPGTGGTSAIGPTAGLRLGHIMHPLVFNVRTGIVFNPNNPANTVSVPLNIQAGLRTSNFEFGLQYTPVFNIMNPGQVEHLFGAGLAIPLP